MDVPKDIKNPRLNWWAPVWRGLVVDQDAKHYRRMKSAVWLFLHFILHAERRTGKLSRKTETIAREMGVSPKTIQRWLKTLKDQGYIQTKSNGRCLEIGIKLWKNTQDRPKPGGQCDGIWPVRMDKTEDSRDCWNGEKSFSLSPKMRGRGLLNDR